LNPAIFRLQVTLNKIYLWCPGFTFFESEFENVIKHCVKKQGVFLTVCALTLN